MNDLDAVPAVPVLQSDLELACAQARNEVQAQHIATLDERLVTVENLLQILEVEKALFAEQLQIMKDHCRKLDDDVFAAEDELSRKRLELNSLGTKVAAQKQELARESQARLEAEARVLRLADALAASHARKF